MNSLKRSVFFISMIFCLGVFSTYADQQSIPATNSAVTFIYYKDLTEGEKFYGEVLGFEKEFDGGWVKIFRIANGGRVGLVDESKGYLKTASEKPVMISIDTDDVKGWYERIKKTGPEYLETHLKDHSDGFANSFMMKDPVGYTVEFFQWNEKPY